jgi:protein ATS1
MVICALGSNKMGQLGLGHCEDVSTPTRCLQRMPHSEGTTTVASISGGANHTIVRFQCGYTWMAGCEVTGDDTTQSSDLKYAEFSCVNLEPPEPHGVQCEKFKACTATWEASIFVAALNDRDYVLVRGAGPKGELGLGQDVINTGKDPRCLALDFPPKSERIVDISSGLQHTAVVLENGEIWGWGYGRKGQLGGSVTGVAWEPAKVEGIGFPAVRVACGREFTVVVGRGGQVAVLGGQRWNIKAHAPENGVPGFIDVQASWHGVYVLLEDRSLLSWGRNDKGQLRPTGLPPVQKFAAGSEHVLALTTNGQVLAWGWGEHGNCGLLLDQKKNVKVGTWNVLWDKENEEKYGKAIGVGAGCATSFIEIQG